MPNAICRVSLFVDHLMTGSPIARFAVDFPVISPLFLIYTGKEGDPNICKVLMVVVVNVRWLRLRAFSSKDLANSASLEVCRGHSHRVTASSQSQQRTGNPLRRNSRSGLCHFGTKLGSDPATSRAADAGVGRAGHSKDESRK